MDLWQSFTPPANHLDIVWEEEYVLSENKQAVLSKLSPNIPEYYFYHCLHKSVKFHLYKEVYPTDSIRLQIKYQWGYY
jgi:hypothetical protein